MIYSLKTGDKEEFELHYRGPDYHGALLNIFQELRSKAKHTDIPMWGDAYQMVIDILNDREIDIP